MWRRGLRWAGCAATAVGAVWLLAAIALAENPGERNRAATERVVKALRYEAEGKNAQRENLLQEALEESPDHAAAHWHSGHVRLANRWVKFDQAPQAIAQDERLDVYRRIRAEQPDTVDGNLTMAAWCEKRKLPEQRRAHLSRVLHLDPEHAEARRLLGYRLVDGTWLTPEEVNQAAARTSAALAALREWQPKLAEIQSALRQRNPKQREAAEARLAAIQDPAAIPAIELVFCARDEATALEGVEKLAGMAAAEASVALARQAALSPWLSVRGAAIDKLKIRKFETFVPVLLSALRSPIQSRAELWQEPTGRLVYRHVFYQEGAQRNELAVLDSFYSQALIEGSRPILPGATPEDRVPGTRLAPVVDNYRRAADRAAVLHLVREDAARKARMRETALAQQNASIQDLNDRVCRVLSESTGQNPGPSADDWWNWWVEYHEVYVPGYKPTNTTYRRDQTTLATQEWVSYIPRHGCLAAGTRVWTETGPLPIDKVRVGDRVLSQNIETGELTYKPVLATTVREAPDLVRLDLFDDAIRCSPAHPFWISGHGWVRARDIKPGMQFHGAAGTTPMRQVGQSGPERVHNLIVADYHSYFVGEAMVLSHDITGRTPTNLRVPGLAGR